MEVQEVPQALTPASYIAQNLADARDALRDVRGLLIERPSIAPPAEHTAKAIAKALTAAEHLFDVGQVNEGSDAVHEALAAAQIIMDVVHGLENPRPGIVSARAQAADRLLTVDQTLERLEQQLHLTPSK